MLTEESITFTVAHALAVIYCSVCGMEMNFLRAVVEEKCVITSSNFAWWKKIMDYRKDSRHIQKPLFHKDLEVRAFIFYFFP